MSLADDIERIIDSGVKGVLSFPNFLRDLSDESGEFLFGELQEGSSEFERIARREGEEYFASKAGAQTGRTALSFVRKLGPGTLLFIGVGIVLIFALRGFFK